ncbi:MAG: DmsE family decaheme c-type cytochrome [Acidobacteriota bacterium]|nr:DmsE family decaheme c-type cytochrome [Acidobacteriota bacterium]
MNLAKRAFPLVPAFLIACGILSAGAARPQAGSPPTQSSAVTPLPTGGQYADNNICQTCHQEVWDRHFANTPHSALLKGEQHGCQSCHGPGQAHVDGGGDVTKITRFETLTPAQTAAICTKCHQSSLETQNFAKSAHLASGVSCTSCHSPHKSSDVNFMLIKPQTELCYGCHAAQKAEFARPYRHRVDAGLIQCSDCHNPHGTQVGHQVRAAAGQFAVCTKCHTDTMGPFVFEHAPVKTESSCLNCHTPHGSTNPRLLQVNNVNFLCLRCHTPNTNGAAPGAPSFHNQNTKYQACTLCHTQIHGSNFSPVFFR